MPLDAWFLLIAAVGLGLSMELAFYRGRRRERKGAEGGRSGRARAGGLGAPE